ncbi:MAG TPA: hypothetical protein VMZ04_05195 [Anaerolineae bacterium]|nr:hypothetical protein [Anaerolineae bacterium]
MITAKKYVIAGVAIFLMILFATLTPQFTWTLSPFYYLGVIFIIIGATSTFIVKAWRGETNQVICNRGHTSIRLKDIFTIPWQETASEDTDRKISLGSMKIMLTGGFDIGLPWGMSWPGPVEAPVYIFPATYHEKEQNDFHIHANLTHYKIQDLPSYLREEIYGLNKLRESKDRIHPTRTPIWYGTTSHMDGSATPENLRIERERKHENRELTESEDRQERLYKAMRKQENATKKEYIIGKPIKTVDEE